jgi:hypothetical protein
MKKMFGASVLLLLILQICLLPSSVQGTAPCPTVSTLAATNIGDTTATLNGFANVPQISLLPALKGIIPASSQYAVVGGFNVYVSFQYGITSGVYSRETPTVLMTEPGNFQAVINDLPPCTTHYARAKRVN